MSAVGKKDWKFNKTEMARVSWFNKNHRIISEWIIYRYIPGHCKTLQWDLFSDASSFLEIKDYFFQYESELKQNLLDFSV